MRNFRITLEESIKASRFAELKGNKLARNHFQGDESAAAVRTAEDVIHSSWENHKIGKVCERKTN